MPGIANKEERLAICLIRKWTKVANIDRKSLLYISKAKRLETLFTNRDLILKNSANGHRVFVNEDLTSIRGALAYQARKLRKWAKSQTAGEQRGK